MGYRSTLMLRSCTLSGAIPPISQSSFLSGRFAAGSDLVFDDGVQVFKRNERARECELRSSAEYVSYENSELYTNRFRRMRPSVYSASLSHSSGALSAAPTKTRPQSQGSRREETIDPSATFSGSEGVP